MNQRRIFPERVIDIEGPGQLLVVAINETDGSFSGFFVDGCNCRDNIAHITYLFAGKDLLVLDRKAESLVRHIGSCQNCRDAPYCARPAGVEASNLCVGHGTAKEFGVQHRRQDDIHRIGRASRYGFGAVEARMRLSYNLETSHDDYFFGGA